MSDEKLVVDFLVGMDDLTPKMKELSAFGIVFDKDLSKAQSRLTSFNDVLKQTGTDFISLERNTHLSAQNILDSIGPDKINSADLLSKQIRSRTKRSVTNALT